MDRSGSTSHDCASYEDSGTSDRIQVLETYIRQLQERNEELEVRNEELMLSNEELRQRTKELDRRTEELDEEREELQRLNEELESTRRLVDVGMVFVDRDLHIQRYAGSAEDLFHLCQDDLGRPLSHMNHDLQHERLPAQIEQVVARGDVYEEELVDTEGEPYLLRIRPYRGPDGRPDGAVLFLTGLSALHQSLRRLEDLTASSDSRTSGEQGPLARDFLQMQDAFQQLPVYVFTQDRELRYTWMSNVPPGKTLEDFLGYRHIDVFDADEARRLDEIKEQVIATGEPARMRVSVVTEGQQRYFDTFLAPRYDREGTVIGLVGASVDVTDRKDTDDQFRRLVDEVEEYAIFMLNPGGKIITWNEGARKIMGYEEEEILGRHFSTFYTEEARAKDRPAEVLDAAAREGHIEREGWRVRKDGSRFWARVTVTSCIDEEGHLRGYLKVTRNMTEQRAHEKELRASERRYRRLIGEAQEGIAITSPDGTIVDANPAVCEMTGYSHEELTGMQAMNLYVYPEARMKTLRRLEEEGRFRNLEIRVRRRDGTVIVCQVSASTLQDADGNTEAFRFYARDVTEQKQARRALEESERKFRELSEQSIMGIALVQGESYRYVNPRMAEMLGYRPEELIDEKGPRDLVHPADWRRVGESLRRCLSGEEPSIYYQARGIRKDGEAIEFEVHGTRIHSGGKPAVLVYLVDITDQRQLQRDILRIQEEERQRMGQDLHDGVASQLTGVSMLLSSAIEDAASQSAPVVSDLRRIKELINESSDDVRRISRGLNPVNLEQGNLPSALERLAETVSTPGGPSCRCEVDCTIQENGENVATHLYWIAQEAVTNARKYASAKNVSIRLFRDRSYLVLSVTDDGDGFNGPSSNEAEGMGLRTMRYRAELIGGTLTIDSCPGEGTTIRCQVHGL